MISKNSERRCNLLASSSQHAEHVQLVACGVNTPSSMSAWRLRPPYRIDLFQSLLEPRPQRFSNSLGVYQPSLCFIHRPRPPEPRRVLKSSAVVVLQRIGRISMFIGCSAQFPLELDDVWWLLLLLFWWFWLLTCCSTCCSCWWTSAAICSAVGCCCCCWMTMALSPSDEFASPDDMTLLEMKPLLSRQSIGFMMCCIWSLEIIEPTGRVTGTLTNFLQAKKMRVNLSQRWFRISQTYHWFVPLSELVTIRAVNVGFCKDNSQSTIVQLDKTSDAM